VFNWIELRRVRRLVDQRSAGCFDRFTNAFGVVRAEIVHDHDVSVSQRRHERLSHEVQECLASGAAFVRHQAANTVERDGSDDGEIGPVIARSFSDCSLADQRSAVERRHRRVRAGFVHKNQTRSGDLFDSFEVLPSTLDDVGSIAFFGDEGLFFTE
jgi:hypothetical protein